MGFKRELNGIIMDIALQWYVSPFPPTILLLVFVVVTLEQDHPVSGT